MGDGVDNDGDGLLDMIDRPYFRGFWAPGGGFDWTTGGSTSFNGRSAVFSGSADTLTLGGTFRWESGAFVVNTETDFSGGSALCTIEAQNDQGGWQSHALTDGFQAHLFDPSFGTPPYDLTLVQVNCAVSSGSVELEWIEFANGRYGPRSGGSVSPTGWAPARDQSITADAYLVPFGGRETTILRAGRTASDFIAGTDVGGVGYSLSGTSWSPLNGDAVDFLDNDDMNVTEVFSLSTEDYWALAGRTQGGSIYGGLFRTEDSGTTWTELSHSTFSPTAATRKAAECGGTAHGGGELLVETPSGDEILAASHHDNYRGLRVVGVSSGAICSTPSDPFPDLPDDGYIGALRVVESGQDGHALAVGYKARDQAGATSESLWLCDLPSAGYVCGSTWSCSAETGSEGLDVRDFDFRDDHSNNRMLFVADGGRRYDSATGTCETIEADVLGWDYDGGGSLWSLDDTCTPDTGIPTTSCPTAWSIGYSEVANNLWGQGNLLPPYTGATQSLTHELLSLTIADSSDQIFAFFGPGHATSYRHLRVYRADLPGGVVPVGNTLDWVPLQDASGSDGDAWDKNRDERDLASSGNDSWMDDQEWREAIFPNSPVDGLVVTDLFGNSHLYVAGATGIYRVPAQTGSTPGFDTVYGSSTLDLDELPWELTYADGAQFQSNSVTDVGWCDACTSTAKGTGVASLLDLGLARIYGEDFGGSRQRADIDCHFGSWGAQGRTVDHYYYEDGDASTPDEVIWMGVGPQSSTSEGQAVLRSEDGGETWCYEGTDSHLSNTLASRLNGNELMCKNQVPAADDWPPCDSAGDGDLLEPLAGSRHLGHVFDIQTIAHDLAVASFWEGNPGTTEGGVWVLQGDSGDLSFAYDLSTDMATTSACSLPADDVFEDVAMLAVHPDDVHTDCSDAANPCRMVVAMWGSTNTDPDCGAFYVELDQAGGSWSSSWTSLPLEAPADPCSMTVASINGAVIPPWDTEGAYLYGDSSSGTAGGICRYDLGTLTQDEEVLPPSVRAIDIQDLAPHPHLARLFYVGVETKRLETCATCDDPGIFVVGQRYRADLGTWVWPATRLRMSGSGMPSRQASSIDFASYEDYVDRLVIGTSGSGPIEAAVAQ